MTPHHAPPRTGHEQAVDALSRVAPAVSRWMERLLAAQQPPLTLVQYLTLRAVVEDDPVGAELAHAAGVSPSAVAQVLAGLEQEGLLARARASADRRRQTIVATTAGERALRSAEAGLRSRLGGLMADLPPPEARELARGLRHLHSLMTGIPPPRHPRRPHRPPPAPPHG
jgi:DNA-binding MarR family transcriptional regulator